MSSKHFSDGDYCGCQLNLYKSVQHQLYINKVSNDVLPLCTGLEAGRWVRPSLSGGTGDWAQEIRGLRPVTGLSSPGHWSSEPELGLCSPLIGHNGPVEASDWLAVTQPPALVSPPRPGSGHWRQMPHGPRSEKCSVSRVQLRVIRVCGSLKCLY